MKLHTEFQVGENRPNDFPTLLGLADMILASLAKAENAAAFQAVRDSLVTADIAGHKSAGNRKVAKTEMRPFGGSELLATFI